MAALLAREGFTASPDVFEHRQGFFEVFNGAGNYDADAVLRDWAEPFDIVTPGIAIKRYPCCGSTHPAIDAMLDLVSTHALTPDNVARIVSWTHPRRLAHTNRPTVRSALDAKFSVQYCLARALVDREVVLSQFDDGAYLDPRVADVMARIEAAPHPDMAAASTAHFGAEVTVTMTDGRRLSKAVDIALGRTSANPLPRSVLEAKYRDCAARVLDGDAVARSLELLANFESLDRVAALGDVLAAGCASERDERAGPGAGGLTGLVSFARPQRRAEQTEERHGAWPPPAACAHRRRRAAADRAVARARRLSEPAGALDRRLRARRLDRHSRPRDRPVSVGEARPDLHHREPARRGQQHRDRGRRQCSRPTATRC